MSARKIKSELGSQGELGESDHLSPRLFEKRMALNVDEIAWAIGRTPKAIYRLIEKNQIPARKVGGRWVFIPEEIERWLKKGKATYAKV